MTAAARYGVRRAFVDDVEELLFENFALTGAHLDGCEHVEGFRSGQFDGANRKLVVARVLVVHPARTSPIDAQFPSSPARINP